ncbi:T9SS type A sorting domain-containing protein [Rubrivirga marina]|uniref:Secretion system C-terminal sorting domain-containing protein n=1 Tax=Rubrivirga marina TaxID=1196024 RepID=A0A271IZ95_9BACT|nr:T9SS type A sorting domain-containing protein [Rubrivirga marina]PAP76450.1 hypothetical protein BSZ37_08345 [Rubrivirga marina]
MRRFATLLLVLALTPLGLAQVLPEAEPARPAIRSERAQARTAADTLRLTNVPDGAQITIYDFTNGNGRITGLNNFYDQIGTAYTLPDGEEYELVGLEALFFDVSNPGDSIDLQVYSGTVDSGPQGDPLYVQTFDTADLVGPETGPDGTTVFTTFLEFDEPLPLTEDTFFAVFDLSQTQDTVSVVSTVQLSAPAPETVVFFNGAWERLTDLFQDPFNIYLLADAVVVRPGPVGPIPIADARAQGSGATVTFEGTVTRSEGAFTYLQDETGGLTIRQTSGDFFDAVADNTVRPGATLRVTGTLSEFNGLLQINNADLESFEPIAYPPVPEPQEVTLQELATNGEAYEGELVLVTDVTFADPPTQFEAATTYQVSDPTDDSNAVTVRVPNAEDTEIEGTDFLGDPSRVTGVVGQFSSTDPDAGYQILLVSIREVLRNDVAVGEDPEGRLALGALVPNPSASAAEATVSLAEAGRATLVVYDVLGREVARVLDRALPAGDHAVRVDVSGLPAGAYVARLSAAGTTVARPFTVVR